MNGLLAHMRREGLVDEAYLAAHVAVPEGFWDALDADHDLWSIARTCDLAPADLQRFYELFAATPRTVTMFSQGINQSIRGTDQVNAIVNLHLATGRIGKPGAANAALFAAELVGVGRLEVRERLRAWRVQRRDEVLSQRDV